MTDSLPACIFCGHGLDRVDHYGIGHFILDNGIYRDVGVYDGVDGQAGIASEIDLRCGYCGGPLTRGQRAHFYQRWIKVLEART